MNLKEKHSEFKERLTTTAVYETYIDTKRFIQKHKVFSMALLVLYFTLVLSLVPIFHNSIYKPENTKYFKVDSTTNEFEQKIYVTVTGEVKNPGMYEMTTENRVADAIENAGGFTENAYTDNINLAQKLTDEQYINITSVKDITPAKVNNTSSSSEFIGIVNINTATLAELCQLPGIGETIANNIIEYRQNAGNFERIEDIQNVKGIGSEKFNKLKNNITI